MFRERIKIVIEATDGFSVVSDEFEVLFYKIPALTVIYYIAVIGSGLLTFIGLFRYRGIIYGILCKHKYRVGNFYITEG